MHIFYIKSLLSIVIIFFTLVALFTMFEIFGRTDKRFNAETLKKVSADTMVGGATLTGLLGTSAWYAPGAAGEWATC